MIRKLHHLNISPLLIHSQLPHQQTTSRQSGYTVRYSIIINTGSPQGCVLSPLLYTLPTTAPAPHRLLEILWYWHSSMTITQLQPTSTPSDIHKCSQQILSAIWKPRALSVAPHLLSLGLLYKSIIQPILLFLHHACHKQEQTHIAAQKSLDSTPKTSQTSTTEP